MLLVVLVIAHILFAAVWFGSSLALPTLSRAATAGSGEAVAVAGGRIVQFMTGAVGLWYLFALAAFFVGGGFSAYTPPYHASLTLGLALVLIQLLVIRPSWAKVAAGDESGRKRLAMWLGVGHLLWFVILVLMFFGPKWAAVWAY